MSIRTTQKLLTAAIGAAVVLGTVTVPVPAQADGGCIPGDAQGLVPRNARPGDMVCVPEQIALDVKFEDSVADERRDPNGAYGPLSCKSGFVWREAFGGDQVCVTPERRVATWQQNANAGVGPTGGLAPQPGAGCTWKFSGTSVLELDNGNLVEMRFFDLGATGPFRMVVKDRFGSLTVYDGDVISAYKDPDGSSFTIAWFPAGGPQDNDTRFDTYDFNGRIDPTAGTLSGTFKSDAGVGQWKARERWTCTR